MRNFLVIYTLSLALARPLFSATMFPGTADVGQILSGFFMGMSSDLELPNIENCLSSLEDMVSHFEDGVSAIEAADVFGTRTGLSEFATALQDIPAAISNCAPDAMILVQDLESGIKAFSSPWSFVYHVGKDLLVNGRDIYSEVNSAVSDWNSAQWHSFGYNVGLAMFQILPTAAVQPNLEGPGFEGAFEIIDGFLAGMGSDLHSDDISKCVQDAWALGADLQTAMEDFEQENFEGVKSGLAAVGAAFGVLPDAITACANSYDELADDIERAANSFTHPWSLVFHMAKSIVVNGQQIFSELSNAMGAWQTAQWKTCGYDLAQAMSKSFALKAVAGPGVVGYFEVIGGLAEGLSMDLDVEALKACVTDSDDSLADFETSVKDFELKTFSGAYTGLKALATGLGSLPRDLRACKAADEGDVKALEKALAVFSDPWSLVWVMGKTLVLDGRQIYNEVETAITDWRDQDWFGFGDNVGEALFQFAKHD